MAQSTTRVDADDIGLAVALDGTNISTAGLEDEKVSPCLNDDSISARFNYRIVGY